MCVCVCTCVCTFCVCVCLCVRLYMWLRVCVFGGVWDCTFNMVEHGGVRPGRHGWAAFLLLFCLLIGYQVSIVVCLGGMEMFLVDLGLGVYVVLQHVHIVCQLRVVPPHIDCGFISIPRLSDVLAIWWSRCVWCLARDMFVSLGHLIIRRAVVLGVWLWPWFRLMAGRGRMATMDGIRPVGLCIDLRNGSFGALQLFNIQ